MQNTRQEIIDYLKERRTATVAALSQALAYDPPQHPAPPDDLLQEQGLVKACRQAGRMHPGAAAPP